jgi:hypothetical protein
MHIMFSMEFVQASDRLSLSGKASCGQHIVEPFENRGGDTGRVLFELLSFVDSTART